MQKHKKQIQKGRSSSKILGSVITGRENNIDFVRFVAATFVIFSHAYPLSGNVDGDIINRVTEGEFGFGGLSVSVFFVLSGFLITKSMSSNPPFVKYFKARCKRLLPELWIVVFASVFIIGPLITTLSLSKYFTNSQTYIYLLSALLIIQHKLPGVFINNSYNESVNGSLWVLPIEFICYIGVFLANKWGILKERRFMCTVPFAIAFASFGPQVLGESLSPVVSPITMFYMGMALYVYRDYIVLSRKYISICLLLIVALLFYASILKYLIYILLPYFIIGISFISYKFKNFTIITFKKEISYDIYLWGFIVEQLFVHFFVNIEVIMLFVMSMICAMIIGYITKQLSEHIIQCLSQIKER